MKSFQTQPQMQLLLFVVCPGMKTGNASSRAKMAIFGPFGRILINSVEAVTLSPLTLRTMRLWDQIECHRSTTTRVARHSHNCFLSESPICTSNIATSSLEIGHPKNCWMRPSIDNYPPNSHGDASVPISTIMPLWLKASRLKNRSR